MTAAIALAMAVAITWFMHPTRPVPVRAFPTDLSDRRRLVQTAYRPTGQTTNRTNEAAADV